MAPQRRKLRGKGTTGKQKVGVKKAVPNLEGESTTVNIPND